MLERLAALDVAVFEAVHHALWGTPWLAILTYVQMAGEAAGLSGFFVFVILLAPVGRRVEFTSRVFAPVCVAAAVCEAIKHLVNAERPRTLLSGLVLNPDPQLPQYRSWPSGHTTVVFAFASAILLLRLFGEVPPRRWTAATIFAFVVAVTTGLARVAVGAHFPGDVLGGAILGVASAHLVVRGMDGVVRRRQSWSRH